MESNGRDTKELTMQETRNLYTKYEPLSLMFREDIRNMVREEMSKYTEILFTRIKNLLRYGE